MVSSNNLQCIQRVLVLSGIRSPHITGNGVGFKPKILDVDVLEGVLEVTSEDAVKMARELAPKEGLLCSEESKGEDIKFLNIQVSSASASIEIGLLIMGLFLFVRYIFCHQSYNMVFSCGNGIMFTLISIQVAFCCF